MKIKGMKFIDETFGPLICFGFYWYNLIKGLFSPLRYKINPPDIKNILVIKFFGMGSIILAGPMLRALRQKFPNAKLIILTFLNNEELCKRIELIDEVVSVDPSSFLRFIKNLISAILYLRKKHCEISIDMEFFAKSSTLIQYLCGAKIRIGYYLVQIGFLLKMMWRGNLPTHNVYYNPHRHTSEAFLALARSVGADTNDMSPAKIKIYDGDRFQLNKLLSDLEIKFNVPLIAMNINASQLCLERRWPIEKFVELTKRILAYKDTKIILIGDVHDKEYINGFLKIMQNNTDVIDLTGKLSIGMLAALFENVKLFITNDSGPLHLAVSIGVPTVSFFGPEIPERFGPIGENHTVFYSDVYCSPCLNVYNQKTAPCNGENKCMRDIPVEDVYRAIVEKYLK